MNIRKNPFSLGPMRTVMPDGALKSLRRLTVARILTNLLDVLGLAGVGALALAFIAVSDAAGGQATLKSPLLGQVVVTEAGSLILSAAIVGVFVLKSTISIWLKLRTSLIIASLESDFSRRLALDFFSGEGGRSSEEKYSVSEFQNVSMVSTEGLAFFLNARLSAIAEMTLLGGVSAILIIVNPIAAAAASLYVFSVLWALSKVVTAKIRKHELSKLNSSRAALSQSRDLFGVRREVRAAGVLSDWIVEFTKSRSASADSLAFSYNLSGLPRYVIETSLVLGFFFFAGGVVLFSDLASQAATIGIFMAGSLRIVALLLPLQASMNQMTQGLASGEPALVRLASIANRNAEFDTSSSGALRGGAMSLEFRDVTFGFDPEKNVLDRVSFTVKAGQKVAIVGPSGAGKSTCFELATGFREPQSGVVKLAGELAGSVLGNGGGLIGIVPQRSYLVSGTLAENVSLVNRDDTDQNKVVSCLKMAGLKEFSQPGVVNMVIEPDSGQFSGGEIQRLGLARALYRNPGILFLDEATSALDAKTEDEVNKSLDELRGSITIVLIAHRLSTVKTADKIIYLEKGQVIAEGTFNELRGSVPNFEEAVSLMGLGE
jgi:ABC-type multidrug transport system fused ATPase/permease subunit